MNKLLVLLTFITISVLLSAQDLRKGFIFSKGDTIRGVLKFQGDIKNSKECIFISDSESMKKFVPFDIDGYMFEYGKFYVSRYIKRPDTSFKVFAEYLVKGQKDLLYYRDYSDFHYLIKANDSSLIEIPYTEKVSDIEGLPYLQESNQHIGLLKAYFSDCPTVFQQIEKLKKPDTKSLISITKTYHDVVCGENSCVVYGKKKMPLKIAIEPRFELTKFRGESGYFNQYGGLFHIWLPASNENLYIKSGLLYSSFANDNSMYKIPLRFEYVFPKKIIKPRLDLGVNVYSFKNPEYNDGMALTMAVSGGFLVKVSKFMYLDLSIETDILQFSYQTNLFLSHSFGIGAFILF